MLLCILLISPMKIYIFGFCKVCKTSISPISHILYKKKKNSNKALSPSLSHTYIATAKYTIRTGLFSEQTILFFPKTLTDGMQACRQLK